MDAAAPLPTTVVTPTISNEDKEELTAEWTVHAQLKLVRPGDVKRRRSLSGVQSPREGGLLKGDKTGNEGKTQTFVYKWRSDCPDKAITDTFDTSKVCPVVNY